MKSSSIILITAVLLFFGALTAYNVSLKASYLTGKYKVRFNKHAFTPLAGVNELQLKSANMISIGVESGAEDGIWISDRLKGQLKITQEGSVLVIDVADKKLYTGFGPDEVVLISNKLNKLQTYCYYDKNREMMEYYRGTISIDALKSDSLNVILDNGSYMTMDDVTFGTLKSRLGGKGSAATLTIDSKSIIGTADFDVEGSSTLQLNNPKISSVHYLFSDSCSVSMTGKVARQSLVNNFWK